MSRVMGDTDTQSVAGYLYPQLHKVISLPLCESWRVAIAAVLGMLALGATRAQAQDRPLERLVTRDGVRLDYPPNGVWRAKGRRVAQARAGLRRAGRTDQLNAPAAEARITATDAAVSGVLRIPSILLAFADTPVPSLPDSVDYDSVSYTTQPLTARPYTIRDTPVPSLPDSADYDSVFYTTQPLTGRPYTIRTLYEEMSNGLLRVEGVTFGWRGANNSRSYYLDACGATANALDCSAGRSRMRELFTTALSRLDPTVDFRQFDNDGADGIPHSGDDDGVVDVVQFVLPVVGGECGGRGIWAHKFSIAGLGGGDFVTNDGGVKISAYHLVAGVGGSGCTDSLAIMGIGTASHELGHGLGLPDLYDTGGDTEGVGEWCLMGSANFRSLLSPGHLSAWSKEWLGWVQVRELTRRGIYSLGPIVLADTVFLIRPTGTNPRGEYFLLENKQANGSDTANMQSPSLYAPAKLGGLLVWHIVSTKVATGGFPFTNSVNAGPIHGVSLVQADGRGDLEAKANRGDAGDPYPGTTSNLSLSKLTQPPLLKNSDRSFAGFGLKGIRQDVPGGSMSFRLSFGFVIRATDTLAQVVVNGGSLRRFQDVVDSGTTLRVSIPATQLSADGRARFAFLSWSDGGPAEHDYVVSDTEDSLLATVDASYQLRVQNAGGGEVSSAPSLDLSGEFLPAGTQVTLTATPLAGYASDGWSGDTTATGDTLRLRMQRPYTLTAYFARVLAVAPVTPPDATMGARYLYRLTATGGTGSYLWQRVSGDVPSGMQLLPNGALTGTPAATGTFTAVARVQSGSQARDVPMVIRVVAPVVSQEAVIAHLVGAADRLTADEIRYFDLLGNGNRRLDVGDFAAWVEKTGVRPSAELTAALARRRAGGR